MKYDGIQALFYKCPFESAEYMPERVTDLADPQRCKGAAPDGQCRNRAVNGQDYCEVHNVRAKYDADHEDKRLYHLTQAQYRNRLAQLSEHEQIKTLRDEIALTRMLIEKRFNLINTDSDLLAACGPINSLLLTVERLVKSAHTIEQNLGILLSKPALLKLGQTLCEIIIQELHGVDGYEMLVDNITERLIAAIASAKNLENQT